jgi:hypothetical protein
VRAGIVAEGSWARGGDEVVFDMVAVVERIEVVWADVDVGDGGELGGFSLGGGSMSRPAVGRVFEDVEGKVLLASVAVAVAG